LFFYAVSGLLFFKIETEFSIWLYWRSGTQRAEEDDSEKMSDARVVNVFSPGQGRQKRKGE
jgi:hypothetical protein